MTEESDVLFENVNNAGVATLNRPKSLNALNMSMVKKLLPQLIEWERSRTCVIAKGAGGKAFCAGGDVRADLGEGGDTFGFAFYEYNVNYLIGNYRIPYIALIDGIAMGGGLGVSVHGRYRVATENAIVAMPETLIGLLPDVGGTYFLPRLRNHLGFYMGLTGKRLHGKDVVISGIATHYVQSARLHDLERRLSLCTNDAEIQCCLDSFSEHPGEFSLADNIRDIDYCFSSTTVEEIIQKLKKVNNEWANETLKTLARMCPTMLKVALVALRRGRRLDLGQCLQMEYRVTARCVSTHNLREGVRALLVDRDNKPQWRPATLAEVSDEQVNNFFNRLPEDKELNFFHSKL